MSHRLRSHMIAIGVLFSAIVLGAIVATSAHAAPASPTFTVLDTANLFTPSEVDAITKRIAEIRVGDDQKVIVYTVPNGLRADLPTYAAKLKKYWDVQRVIVIEAPSTIGGAGVIGDSFATTASPSRNVGESVLGILTEDSHFVTQSYSEATTFFTGVCYVIMAFLIVIAVLISAGAVLGQPRRY